MKRIAIICAAGIGDALITSIAAHALRGRGVEATVFSPHLRGFGRWLEEGEYAPYPEEWAGALRGFDAALLQHDNTPRARAVVALRAAGLPVYVFYTNYRTSKHGPLVEGFDFPFDEGRPMVHNTCRGVRELFGIETRGQSVLRARASLRHRGEARRVLIHPTSTDEAKNWPRERFLQLAKRLEKKGFEPMFLLSPKEREGWEVKAPLFETLADLADAVYEAGAFVGNDSGPAHLASYLSIPLAVICQGRQMPLWSPGWLPPTLIVPPRWVPNIKGMRLREEKWKYFISTRRVLGSLFHALKQNRTNLYYQEEEERAHERHSPPHEEAQSPYRAYGAPDESGRRGICRVDAASSRTSGPSEAAGAQNGQSSPAQRARNAHADQKDSGRAQLGDEKAGAHLRSE